MRILRPSWWTEEGGRREMRCIAFRCHPSPLWATNGNERKRMATNGNEKPVARGHLDAGDGHEFPPAIPDAAAAGQGGGGWLDHVPRRRRVSPPWVAVHRSLHLADHVVADATLRQPDNVLR